MSEPTAAQVAICSRFKVEAVVPSDDETAGIALQTRGRQPLNAIRHPPVSPTSGWYIWWGENDGSSEFFQALHVSHLPEQCPEVVPYLGLPAGWGVQLAPGHEDVWQDPAFLKV